MHCTQNTGADSIRMRRNMIKLFHWLKFLANIILAEQQKTLPIEFRIRSIEISRNLKVFIQMSCISIINGPYPIPV